MPATGAILKSFQVLPTLALSTSEDTYTFTIKSDDPLRPTGKSSADVILQADGNWLYAHQAGGPYFYTQNGWPLYLNGVYDGQVVYVKANAGTPNLYAMVNNS
jgi:hypothetical protein